MKNILIFGGTAEGRSIADCLNQNEIFHTVCVATEYGEEVLGHPRYTEIRQGRLGVPEMEKLMREGGYAAVVDATHPYAVEVSGNVRRACEETGLPYLRYLRPDGRQEAEPSRSVGANGDAQGNGGADQAFSAKDRVMVNSTLEAARYLESREGVIFLTTGSKELRVFTEEISDKSRLFARVLPSAEVVASCRGLGLTGKQICAMQGPFSEEMNRAMLRQTKAAFLVSKDTGVTGGFPEKERAAWALGVSMVVIRRPEEAGLDWAALLGELEKILGKKLRDGSPSDDKEETQEARFPSDGKGTIPDSALDGKETAPEAGAPRRIISCIGIGMGTPDTLTHEAARAIQNAQILFGAKRILESAKGMLSSLGQDGAAANSQVFIPEYVGSRIAAYLKEHPQYTNAAVLMSGDVGFYSGARGIGAAFPREEVRYYCGISSVVYFASKIPTAWQDAKLLSAHGKEINLLNYVRRYPKIILLVSGAGDVERLCGELHEAGLEDLRVTVGTNLSYPEETVTFGAPRDFLHCTTQGLHIMMIENKDASHVITPGLPDDAFVRGKVPMTKEEIRILSVAKLQLKEDSVVYDVGAGTGSVSMECARLCTAGTVYAIERNPEGIGLIRENSRRLRLSNVVPVEGLAPGALEELPAPTHAFIGGSSGNMAQIIDALRGKNPRVRVVINTIALESIAEVMALLKERDIADADIVQISAAKSRTLGRYHMMTGLNPVYIISF